MENTPKNIKSKTHFSQVIHNPIQNHQSKPLNTKLQSPLNAQKAQLLAQSSLEASIPPFSLKDHRNCLNPTILKVCTMNLDGTMGANLVCQICNKTVNFYRIYEERVEGKYQKKYSFNYTSKDDASAFSQIINAGYL